MVRAIGRTQALGRGTCTLGVARGATVATLFFLVAIAAAAEPNLGMRVPPGFRVERFADDDLAHDIYSMTIDSAGRVVVAGAGYVKTLHDDDGDHRADRATLFSEIPASGAHGMLFDGNDLICTGDDALRRIPDADADGAADGPGEVWARLRHPEHGANGLARGPDGWLYVICGNDAGVGPQHAESPGSPVKEPRCGAVVRFSPDGRRSEVVAHGFRNPYDLDFSAAGQVFTVDADGERDHHLPWYAPNRLFDIAAGAEHGWLLAGWQRSWNRPESFVDNVERLAVYGRGSPTGLIVYRHRAFPNRYQGAVLHCCWTLGRVYSCPLERAGASYTGSPEVFLQTTGDVGFAPVDLAVGPEGDLYIAIGGRRTRGGVFRVWFDGDQESDEQKEIVPAAGSHATPDKLLAVLRAPQPQASWSRAAWAPAARKLGRAAFENAVRDEQQTTLDRMRALEIMVDLFDGVSTELAREAMNSDDVELAARAAWALARSEHDTNAQAILAEFTHRAEPLAARAAWEALAALPRVQADVQPAPAWSAGLENGDRRVRRAALLAAEGSARKNYQATYGFSAIPSSPRGRLARLWVRADELAEDSALTTEFIHTCVDVFQSSSDARTRGEAVRLLQISLGDLRVQPGQAEVYSGYLGNRTDAVPEVLRAEIVRRLAPAFPTDDAEVNRELGRLLAMLEAAHDGLLEAVASRWTTASEPEDDVHYLIILSRLAGRRSNHVTHHTAHALVGLHTKLAEQEKHPSRNWPLRVGEAFAELCRRDAALASAVVGSPDFGRAEHTMFTFDLSPEERVRAARRLLAAAEASDEDGAWSAELVRLAAILPDDEVLPTLRAHWRDFALRDAIAQVLADRAQEEDRARLIEALASPQVDVTEQAAAALAKLSINGDAEEIGAVLTALERYCDVPPARAVRRALVALLHHWTEQSIEISDTAEDALAVRAAYRPWFDWFAEAHPTAAASRVGFAGEDAAGWRARLAGVDWSAGETERGRQVFEQRACHRCHRGSQRLGPDLDGVASRFSRDDLFAAVTDPNRDVSPLYQTTLLATHSGRVYHGLVVYESPEGTLLQIDADTTIRVMGDELAVMQPSSQSLMPSGLLANITDQELADLYAYLRSLGPAAR